VTNAQQAFIQETSPLAESSVAHAVTSSETNAASTNSSADLSESVAASPPKRKRGRPTNVPEGITPKKITYYLKNPALEKPLKRLSVETERDLSDLTTEALEDLLKKYGFL
jgi:hypothetical protein